MYVFILLYVSFYYENRDDRRDVEIISKTETSQERKSVQILAESHVPLRGFLYCRDERCVSHPSPIEYLHRIVYKIKYYDEWILLKGGKKDG